MVVLHVLRQTDLRNFFISSIAKLFNRRLLKIIYFCNLKLQSPLIFHHHLGLNDIYKVYNFLFVAENRESEILRKQFSGGGYIF